MPFDASVFGLETEPVVPSLIAFLIEAKAIEDGVSNFIASRAIHQEQIGACFYNAADSYWGLAIELRGIINQLLIEFAQGCYGDVLKDAALVPLKRVFVSVVVLLSLDWHLFSFSHHVCEI